MAWTYSYHIPTVKVENVASSIFAAPVFNEVWIFYETYHPNLSKRRVDLTVFNTETHEMTEKDVKFPENFGDFLFMCVSHNNKIYVCGRMDDGTWIRTIYELDPTSMKFTLIIRSRGLNQQPMFSGDNMYLVTSSTTNSGIRDLLRIDLETKQVINRMPFERPNLYIRNYMMHNELLYITGNVEDSRFVAFWNDGAFIQVCEDTHVVPDWPFREDTPQDMSVWSVDEFSLCLERFDFTANSWTKEVIPKGWQGDDTCKVWSSAEIEGKLYAIIWNRKLQQNEFELRIFDRQPSLNDICLSMLVGDMLLENQAVEEVADKLPMDMRPLLGNMHEWMSYEHGKGEQLRANKNYRDKFYPEIDKMAQEGLIEECLQYWLTHHFSFVSLKFLE